jgi:dephospho-CoA kinase
MGAHPKSLALTGPTGAGKSTVADWLAARGAAIIDADRVGHEVLRMPDIRDAVAARFGDQVMGPDGEIDRKQLGMLVFPDQGLLRALEEISHPCLLAELASRIDTLQQSRVATLVVVDAALWFQWPERPEVDFVLGVRAPLALRVERIRARDAINEAAAIHRVRRQKAIEASLDRSHAVLDTADAPDLVRRRLLEILDEHLGLDLVGTDPA